MAPANADPNTTPAMLAPVGQHSNLRNPPSQTWPPILCMTLAIVVSAPILAIRLYTRQRIHRKLWWDDWTCLLAWIFLIPYTGMLLQSLNYGGCKDLWNVSKADYKKFTKLFHKLEIIARVGMFFTKAAILLLFHRLFVVEGSRRTKVWWAIWFVFWWNLLYAIALVLSVAFQCTGKRAIVEAGKECVNGFAVLICASVINVSTDLMILVIPVVAIWGLRMPSEKKWRLSAVFAIGFLGVLASVARLAYQAVYARRPNKTIIIIIVLLVNAAEQFIGIIVSCLPILPTFYRHLRSKAAESNSSKTSNPVKGLSASIVGRRSGGSKGKAKDPYQIYSTKGYEEIEAAALERRGGGQGILGGIMKDMEMSVISEKRSPDTPGVAL